MIEVVHNEKIRIKTIGYIRKCFRKYSEFTNCDVIADKLARTVPRRGSACFTELRRQENLVNIDVTVAVKSDCFRKYFR